MEQSRYFLKTLREPPKDEISVNARLLEQACYIQKLMAGVYAYLPLGWRVLKKIENIIRTEMNAAGGQELFMPALHPLENYIQTGRADIDVLFHLMSASGKKLVLGQSHEEIIVPLVKKYISSYQDLPLYLYQIQVKFRNELRAKSGILRSREFMMKDLYSFHRDGADFERYYEVMKRAYKAIFAAVGLGDITHLTLASGGTFSQYSHEFQTVTPAGEDMIHICRRCQMAVNGELFTEQTKCPACGHQDFQAEKAIEVGNIFPLKSKFSDAFDLKYTDEKGRQQPIIMGCYGIGLGRVMGAIVEVRHDQNGIIWPKEVTPFQVHLLNLAKNKKVATTLYRLLQKSGLDTLFDERPVSAGIKLNDADLIGITVRAVVSDKTGDEVEMKLRGEGKATLVSPQDFVKKVMTFYQT